jgi:8-amino-7-oxononanoate synthase
MDIFKKCGEFTIVREAKQAGIYPYFLALSENEGTEVEFQGRRLIMCGSNNYLGLTAHPRVREAAKKAVDRFGTSCTGSRFLNGTLELHEQLERELAGWVGKEDALIFSTGMQVNLGTISALVCRDDVVVLDKDDHASIVDGAILSMGKMHRFRHNDLNHLDKVLRGLPEEPGKLVVVDGVYSMGGDLAPLPEMLPILKKYDARLMVDDAHGLGVMGKGKGTAEHFGVTKDVDLIMSTFSKSFASLGGFVAGDEIVISYIKHHARSLMFSASIPPSNTAAALEALHIMQEEPEHVERITAIGAKMRSELSRLGFNIGSSVTPIIPIYIGDDIRTVLIWRQLLDNGVFVNPVVSPGVAPGQQLLRTSYMASHTDLQLERVLEIFERVGKQAGLI